MIQSPNLCYSEDMQAIRKIYEITGDSITISIPENLRHHRLEVILLPLEENNDSWPAGFLDKFAGCMADDPIIRAPQGSYDTRNTLK